MRMVAAEWIKFRTLRSTFWTLLATVVLSIAVTVMGAPAIASRWGPAATADEAGGRVMALAVLGVMVAMVVFGALGVVTVTAEHSTKMIDITHVAMPSRAGVLLAKATVLAAAATATCLVVVGAGNVYARVLVLGAAGPRPSLLPPQAWRFLAGAVLVLVMTTLLGLAIGAMTRSAAVAATSLLALLFVAPLMVLNAGEWGRAIGGYLPSVAGLQLLDQMPPLLPAGTAFAVCAFYAVVPLAVAAMTSR